MCCPACSAHDHPTVTVVGDPGARTFFLKLDEQSTAFVVAMLGRSSEDFAVRDVQARIPTLRTVSHEDCLWSKIRQVILDDEQFLSLVSQFGMAEARRDSRGRPQS